MMDRLGKPPWLAATALDWLYNRTKGDTAGRLVFSRSETEDSPFGKSVFGTYMKEQYKGTKDMDCGALRKRIEIMANQLLKAEKITAADRALVSTLLQHKAETAALDYLPAGDTELTESEPEPAPELEQVSEPEQDSESEPAESTSNGDEKANPIAVETGDIVELIQEYEGKSNMLVSIDGTNLVLELIQDSRNPKHNWTFAPHNPGFKHHVAHFDEFGVHQVCISPSPDLSSARVLELVVNFHSTGVELLDAGGEGHQLHVIGHLDKTSAGATRATDDDNTDEIAPAASTTSDIALLVRLANGGTHTFHQSVFAAVYLVDTGGRDLARAHTEFDDGALRVTWDEGDHGVFPAITEAAEAPEAAEAAEAAEAPEALESGDGDAPGPSVRALVAAFAAAHESDRAAKRRRTD